MPLTMSAMEASGLRAIRRSCVLRMRGSAQGRDVSVVMACLSGLVGEEDGGNDLELRFVEVAPVEIVETDTEAVQVRLPIQLCAVLLEQADGVVDFGRVEVVEHHADQLFGRGLRGLALRTEQDIHDLAESVVQPGRERLHRG